MSSRGVARACPCERTEHGATAPRRRARARKGSTRSATPLDARAKRARKIEAWTVSEAEARGRRVTTSPRPRRVYIASGYVKGEARRRTGRPACAERTRTRKAPGPINAFIGQRPLAAARAGQGKLGPRPARALRSARHERPARRSPPGPEAGNGSCSSAGRCAISVQALTAAPARSRRLRERATTEHVSRGRGRARAIASVRDAREEGCEVGLLI